MKPAILLLSACCLTYGQTPDPAVIFEVASVKESPPPPAPQGGLRMGMRMGCGGGPGTPSPGQYTCSNATVSILISQAFGLKSYQFPTSMDGTRYDVNAKIPTGTTKEQVKIMLQNLLIERFKLAYHFEKKEMQVYELVVGKNGPKLKPSPPEDPPPAGGAQPATPPVRSLGNPTIGPDGFPVIRPGRNASSISMMSNGGTRMSTTDSTIEQLANMLSNQVGRPVTDSTGLKGKYDYTLTFTRENTSSLGGPSMSVATEGGAPMALPPSDAPTIFAAIQDQLGLKLEQKKGTIDIFVIDRVEKKPTEN